MIGFFKNLLFGSDAESAPATAAVATSASEARASDTPDLEAFVQYVVRALVDDSQAVSVQTVAKDGNTEIQVTCAKSDIGKVIGRNGKTIGAIRSLANGAGGRLGRKISVEVLD